ncbi:MAG: phytanoyl-CoA dioxygenase family protein [Capsulimonadaceae bacterium]|nr:phytanoyl-CoA dioxygenase family protein [Capsulimonadaceae bacterium]
MKETKLTHRQWVDFERDGFVRLGRAATDGELNQLQERIDAIMLGTAPIDLGKIYMQLDSSDGDYASLSGGGNGSHGATLNYRKIQNLEFDPIFREYMDNPIFREVCARCYGDDTPIACFRAMFMNKPARKGTLLPWHQDAWTVLDRQPVVTVWTALDPATRANGCVEVVPGTHKLGLVNPAHASGFLSKAQIEQYCTNVATEFVELEAGEAVLLHNWLMHRSDVNKTDISRRAFSVCYADARTISSDGAVLTALEWPVAARAPEQFLR